MNSYHHDWMEPLPSETPPPAPEPVVRAPQTEKRPPDGLAGAQRRAVRICGSRFFCGVQQLLGSESGERNRCGGNRHADDALQHLRHHSPLRNGCVGYCRDGAAVRGVHYQYSVQEVQSFFHRFGPNGSGRLSWRRRSAAVPVSSSTVMKRRMRCTL